jgi:hypothetical protein
MRTSRSRTTSFITGETNTWQAYEVGTLIDHNVVYGSPNGVIDTRTALHSEAMLSPFFQPNHEAYAFVHHRTFLLWHPHLLPP